MIDYIALNKHFQDKDKPFFGHCQEIAAYRSGEIKYNILGCRPLEIYWNESLHRLRLKGSLLYFIQNHNFTYSDSLFREAVEYLEGILYCSLWDSNVDEFEYGTIIEVEKSPKEYILHHFTNEKKLSESKNQKSENFLRRWEEPNVSLKMYDENRNIKLKQNKSEIEYLRQAGWNPELHYLKWEAHYKRPHLIFNGGSFLKLADLLNPAFQERFREDLLYQYSRLSPFRTVIPPENKKQASTDGILLLTLAETLLNDNIPLPKMKKLIYTKINSFPDSVLSPDDKGARKRQIRPLLKRLEESDTSQWDLLEVLKEKFKKTGVMAGLNSI